MLYRPDLGANTEKFLDSIADKSKTHLYVQCDMFWLLLKLVWFKQVKLLMIVVFYAVSYMNEKIFLLFYIHFWNSCDVSNINNLLPLFFKAPVFLRSIVITTIEITLY